MHPPDPLALCDNLDCEVRPHYTNCSGCFGFGVKKGGEPIPACHCPTVWYPWLPCPVCGSTPEGAPGGVPAKSRAG